MSIEPGINLEYIRCKDKPFIAGIHAASKMGYKWVEPMVHNGRELLSEAGYFHSVSMDEDPLLIRDILQQYCVRPSALSAHCPLMRPEVSVPYLEKAVRFAAALGAKCVCTDEGVRPSWVTRDEAHDVMRYTLKAVLRVAERHGIYVGIEDHQEFSKTTEGLLRIATLVDSPMLKINYDTGNALIAGEDPYSGLEACADRLIHVHAKDISMEHASAEQGKVSGTPVGCACGDGLVDWRRVVTILKKHNFHGVLSVECGTPEQAERSLSHLNTVIEALNEHDSLRVASGS